MPRLMTDPRSRPAATRRPVWKDPPAAGAGRRLPQLGRWADPAVLAGALSLAGVLFYVMLRAAVARFYGPLGISPDELDATYPGLLAGSATTIAVLLSLLALLAGLLLVYGWVAVWTLATAWESESVAARVAAGLLVAAATAAISIATWDLNGRLLGTLLIAGILLMAAQSRIGWRGVVIGACGVVVVGFGAEVMSVARDQATLVREGIAPDGDGELDAAVPWSVTVGSVEWHGDVPASLKDVDLKCVLVLGTSKAGTLVYTTDRRGVRRTLVLRPEEALIQRIPDAFYCRWPARRDTEHGLS
jgi:hypothetical protein